MSKQLLRAEIYKQMLLKPLSALQRPTRALGRLQDLGAGWDSSQEGELSIPGRAGVGFFLAHRLQSVW